MGFSGGPRGPTLFPPMWAADTVAENKHGAGRQGRPRSPPLTRRGTALPHSRGGEWPLVGPCACVLAPRTPTGEGGVGGGCGAGLPVLQAPVPRKVGGRCPAVSTHTGGAHGHGRPSPSGSRRLKQSQGHEEGQPPPGTENNRLLPRAPGRAGLTARRPPRLGGPGLPLLARWGVVLVWRCLPPCHTVLGASNNPFSSDFRNSLGSSLFSKLCANRTRSSACHWERFF